MPPEMQTSIFADWPAILGLALAIIGHTWVAFRWIVKQFESRDRALQDAISTWHREVRSMTAQMEAVREKGSMEATRLDKELTQLNGRVENIPTIKEFGTLLDSRLAPLFELVRAVSRAQEKHQ